LVSVFLLGSGCGYYWELREGIETGCVDSQAYFMDADDDGWGAPADYIMACEGDIQSNYVSRNGLDCDDSDPMVTGKTGAICPQGLISGDVEFTGIVGIDREYVVVHESAELVTATTAELACGASGWGGDLARLSDEGERILITDELENSGVTSEFAGFMNIGTEDNKSWSWLATDDGPAAEAFDQVDVGANWCLGVEPTPSKYAVEGSASYSAELSSARLALVVRDGFWCFGSPEQTYALNNEDPEDYTLKKAHFICERSKPNPADYEVTIEDSGL
jgi:hypothetical protein